ncbi:MAG: hypothetical protein JRD03_07435, partial [Deltaproteobacteria bacterium]|nr:hypothetical protein [Deltaproteobacteria bacterium]
MSIQTTERRAAAAAIECAFVIVALTVPAMGQGVARGAPGSDDALAWLGCWDVLANPDDDSQEPRVERQMICVEQGDAPAALDMTVLVDERLVATETIVTNGSRQSVSDGGCDGWIRSVLSEDRRRIYLQSEATCADGKLKNLTGASMMVSGDRWIDIHALWVDGEREVLIQRYRPVGSGLARLPGAMPNAMDNARRAAAARLTVENVIEALQVVDPAVVEAMLLESEASFGIDSDLLLRLDDAGAPGEVIDLMVALSFPDYFSVEGDTVNRRPVVYYGGYWSPWYPYYGYGHYYHHRYSHRDNNRGGKAVSGRGYVAVQQTGNPPGGLSGLFQAGSGGGGGGGGNSGAGGGGTAGGSGSTGGN